MVRYLIILLIDFLYADDNLWQYTWQGNVFYIFGCVLFLKKRTTFNQPRFNSSMSTTYNIGVTINIILYTLSELENDCWLNHAGHRRAFLIMEKGSVVVGSVRD